MKVGVLALQGGFEPHAQTFARLGAEVVLVRRADQLAGLTHLTLPGGESTTLQHLLALFGLGDEIARRQRAGELALFGTCAGAILLGRDGGECPPRMGLLDAAVERNAYGRQVDSFTRAIAIEALGPAPFPCVFIRAPKFRALGPSVRVLARDGGDPILIEAPGLLAASFHPELSGDARIHGRFLESRPSRAWPSAAAQALPSAPV